MLSADALRAAGVGVVMLTEYDGAPVDAIKVGTIKRAKGLEFKQVLLPDVPADLLGADHPAGRTRGAGAVGAEPPRAVRGHDPGARRAVGRGGLAGTVMPSTSPVPRRGRFEHRHLSRLLPGFSEVLADRGVDSGHARTLRQDGALHARAHRVTGRPLHVPDLGLALDLGPNLIMVLITFGLLVLAVALPFPGGHEEMPQPDKAERRAEDK